MSRPRRRTGRPAEETIKVFRQRGGSGPVYSQLTLCWAESKSEAIETAHRLWAFSELPGTLNQDLPTMLHYEEAVKLVTPEMVSKSTPCGPDPEPILDAARKALALQSERAGQADTLAQENARLRSILELRQTTPTPGRAAEVPIQIKFDPTRGKGAAPAPPAPPVILD